ncbi:MAG TPA: group 1 truncated hemoglobin [Gemmatales bacterium]|nr:group 1 truncated hemoglobin [Gemmatales bacterium]
MRFFAYLLLLLAGLFNASSILADDIKMSKSEIDQRLGMIIFDTVSLGTDLYNQGNQEGCHRLYQGALMVIVPMLDSYPDLKKQVTDKFEKAKGMSTVSDKAFAMRELLDMIRKGLNPKKPLWDRLGGEAGVRAVTLEFLVTAAKDPKANIDRNGNYPLTKERVARVEQLVVEQISSVTGGPLKYTGRDMKNSHQGMMITEAEFNAAAGHLIAALKKYNVPQAEIDELVGLVSTLKNQIVEKK